MDDSAIAYLASEDDDTGFEGLEVVRGGSLESVLERVAEGEFSTLVVVRLRAVGGSLRELIALLDWLQDVGARLVATDVDLDTASVAGRRTVAALREIVRWEHEPGPGRAPRGRPGLTVRAPELSERIAGMRERGLSLQAIAEALDADGVPTPRGGRHWRPSSVQAVLGYRRPPPRPPLPPLPRGPVRGPDDPEPPSGLRRGGPAMRPPDPGARGHPGGRGPRRQRKGPRP